MKIEALSQIPGQLCTGHSPVVASSEYILGPLLAILGAAVVTDLARISLGAGRDWAGERKAISSYRAPEEGKAGGDEAGTRTGAPCSIDLQGAGLEVRMCPPHLLGTLYKSYRAIHFCFLLQNFGHFIPSHSLSRSLLCYHLQECLAWRIPCTEEPCGPQSMRTQRVGHDWMTNTQHYKWFFPQDYCVKDKLRH